jgi:hypothetical protein
LCKHFTLERGPTPLAGVIAAIGRIHKALTKGAIIEGICTFTAEEPCHSCVFFLESEDLDLQWMGENGIELHCGHRICFSCMLKMHTLYSDVSSHNKSCPQCREPIRVSSQAPSEFKSSSYMAKKMEGISPQWGVTYKLKDPRLICKKDAGSEIFPEVEHAPLTFMTRVAKQLGPLPTPSILGNPTAFVYL